MKTLIVTAVLSGSSFVGCGFYDAYKHLPCTQIVDTAHQIYTAPNGEITRVTIEKCKAV